MYQKRTPEDPRTTTNLDRFDWAAERTPEEWEAMAQRFEAKARGNRTEAHDSFERCDTDGALSQWASTVTASQYEAAATLARNHGYAEHRALFDAETGELLPTENFKGDYGWRWRVLDAPHERARTVQYITDSEAATYAKQQKFYRKKGVTLGRIRVISKVILAGGNYNVFPRFVPVEDFPTDFQVVTREITDAPEQQPETQAPADEAPVQAPAEVEPQAGPAAETPVAEPATEEADEVAVPEISEEQRRAEAIERAHRAVAQALAELEDIRQSYGGSTGIPQVDGAYLALTVTQAATQA